MLYGKEMEVVTEFEYLGRILCRNSSEEGDIKARIKAAKQTMGKLMAPLYGRRSVAIVTKLAVYRTVVATQMMYAAETGTLRKKEWSAAQTFENHALRRVAGMRGVTTSEGVSYLSTEAVVKEIERVQKGPFRRLRKHRQHDSCNGGARCNAWMEEHLRGKCSTAHGREWRM